MTLIEPWVIYALIWIPVAAAMLALLLVAMVGTQSWRRIPVEVLVFVVILAIAALPQVIW